MTVMLCDECRRLSDDFDSKFSGRVMAEEHHGPSQAPFKTLGELLLSAAVGCKMCSIMKAAWAEESGLPDDLNTSIAVVIYGRVSSDDMGVMFLYSHGDSPLDNETRASWIHAADVRVRRMSRKQDSTRFVGGRTNCADEDISQTTHCRLPWP